MSPGPQAARAVDVEDILRTQRRVLGTLMRSSALSSGDLTSAIQELTVIATEVFDVDRSSVWKFNATRTELTCLDLYDRRSGQHQAGSALQVASRQRYFDALSEERSIAAHHARTDPRTSEFALDYLAPLGISSMLDASVRVRGQLVGVICAEHVGPPRRWTPADELLAGSFGDFMGMILSAAEQHAQAAQLERYRQHLERLVDERTEQLRRSEESFRRLFSASPVALVLSGVPERNVLSINSWAARLFGVSRDESIGKRAPDFWVDSKDQEAFIQEIRQHGVVEQREARLRTAEGREFWASISGQSLEYEGHPALLVGVRDIQTQKLAETALRQSRETLLTLLDSSPVPLVVTRLKDAEVRYCNHPAAVMFETTVEEAVGKTAPNFYENPAERQSFAEQIATQGFVENFSVRLRSFKGRGFWALLNAKRLMLEGEDVFVVGFQDLTQQKRVEEELRRFATVDALTGAWNRRHLLALAEEELQRCERYDRPLSLAMIDADHFKRINDTYGHPAGDAALRMISQTVRQQLRRTDALGRYGGEELAVLLPETDLEAGFAVMERVRSAIAAQPLSSGEASVAVTVSIGLAQLRQKEGLDALLKRADRALYAAKAGGRNRVEADHGQPVTGTERA